ncbi:MAG: cytidylate kinase-like family protein [Candidatus Zixiibacteriota bacterium]
MTSIELLVERQLNKYALRERAESRSAAEPAPAQSRLRVITISRQSGSGGHTLATRLAEALGFECIDRQILDYIAKSANARRRLIASLDERTRPGVDLWVEGILRGRYVDQSEYVHWLVKSVTAMAEHGDAVILGRGGNVILGTRGALHVRIVAPRDVRIANLVNHRGMSLADARQWVEESDLQRRKFHWENFRADIDNPEDYDLMINTGTSTLAEAEAVILELWGRRMTARQ